RLLPVATIIRPPLLPLLLALLLQEAEPVPPVLVGDAQIAYPDGASGDARVELELDVSDRGEVTSVKVTRSGGAAFDEAALAKAKRFRFLPGTYEGKAVPFKIAYAHTFRAPPRVPQAPPTAKPPPRGTLAGRVLERGTRNPLAFAHVAAGALRAE